jgi:hypothetical protein
VGSEDFALPSEKDPCFSDSRIGKPNRQKLSSSPHSRADGTGTSRRFGSGRSPPPKNPRGLGTFREGKGLSKKGQVLSLLDKPETVVLPPRGTTGWGSVNRIGHGECEHQGGYSANSQCEILFAIHGFAPCWRRTSNPHGQLVFRRRPVASASRSDSFGCPGLNRAWPASA